MKLKKYSLILDFMYYLLYYHAFALFDVRDATENCLDKYSRLRKWCSRFCSRNVVELYVITLPGNVDVRFPVNA